MTASRPGADPDRLAQLMARLAKRGGPVVEPPVLYPLRTFVDLAGEDFRRRLFTTTGADGEELALRPDYTIAVALEHLASGPAGRAARYAYCGEVFRQHRQVGEATFLQAGVEWIGAGSGAEGDAALVALAVDVAAELGLPKLALTVGEADFFAAVVGRLDLPPHTAATLARAFGNPDRLARLVEGLKDPANGAAGGRVAGLADAVARLKPEEARRVVATVVEVATGTPFGGRSPDEIAERILSRARANGTAGGPAAAAIIADYLAIACPLAAAPDRLAAFADGAGLDLAAEVDQLATLVADLAGAGIDVADARFDAAFGRRLDYYSGLVFEFHDPARRPLGPLIGGGRYDRLMTLLGADAPLPATGFAIWLDKLGFAPASRAAAWSRP